MSEAVVGMDLGDWATAHWSLSFQGAEDGTPGTDLCGLACSFSREQSDSGE